MGIIFKKGHIIPRWCHVKTADRKAQHNCTFGCDVEVVVSGGVVKMYALSTGHLIDIKTSKRGASRRMKGGSTKYSVAIVEHVHGDSSKMIGGARAGDAARVGAVGGGLYRVPSCQEVRQDDS